MTVDSRPLTPVPEAALTMTGRLAFLAGGEPAGADGVSAVGGWPGGFARDFATADGRRVMVAALTRRQFADLAETAGLTATFAFLERLLHADFSDGRDLYTHRHIIATLLAPWISRRTIADLATAFAGTTVPWARLHNVTSRSRSRR